MLPGTTTVLASRLLERKNWVKSQESSRQQTAKFIRKASTLWARSGLTRGWVAPWPYIPQIGLSSSSSPFPVSLLILHVFSSQCACTSLSLCSGYSHQWVCNGILMTPLGYLWGPPSSFSSCCYLPFFLLDQLDPQVKTKEVNSGGESRGNESRRAGPLSLGGRRSGPSGEGAQTP